jgi:serine/threonine protein kinase/tetratricopeptide (TPR) repeat protein
MGIVYRATDKLTGKTVALKRVFSAPKGLLYSSYSSDDTLNPTARRVALAQEFQVLAALRHPNIISVLDYGFDAQHQPYFTMALVEKPQTILSAARKLPLEKQVDLLIQLLQALAYVHRRGVLHRDLKPGNVLVERGDRVRVLDFGLATEGDHAKPQSVGTLTHIAPEVLQMHKPTEASDLYAVGMIAYEMFAHRYPFDTGGMTYLIDQILRKEPDFTPLLLLRVNAPLALITVKEDTDDLLTDTTQSDLSLDTLPHDTLIADIQPETSGNDSNLLIETAPQPPRLIDVVQKLLKKNPAERYQDAIRVIADLCAAIGQPVPAESDAQRESFLQAAQFVGRDSELARLMDSLDAANNGRGSVWLVGGESGIGKSRLIDELAIRALVHGAIVLRGQGVTGGGLPYQLWREPLRRLVLSTPLDDLEASVLKELVPDIERLLDRTISDAIELSGQAGRTRLYTTIVNVFRRQQTLVLLILEDLHWARRSLDVMQALMPFVSQIPLLVVASYRDDEKPNLPALLSGARLMKLERLSDDAVVKLAESMLGEAGHNPAVIALLQRQTEGNVFFLVEVVRALAEDAGQLSAIGQGELPQTVFAGGIQQIINRRLHRVPMQARRLLKLAAVMGRSIDLRLMQHLYRGNLDAWLTTCSNAAVLEFQDGGWRFTHDKLRESLLNELGKDERGLHRRVAEAIETVYPGEKSRYALLAVHWQIAGNRMRAAEYSYLAGIHFTAISLYNDALAMLEKARDLIGEIAANSAQPLRVAVGIQLGIVYERRSDYAAAQEYLEPALKLAWQLGERELQTQALLQLGIVSFRQGDNIAARDYAEQSLAFAQESGDRGAIADSVYTLGTAAYSRGDLDVARGYIEQSLTIRREIGDRTGQATSLNGLGLIAQAQRGFGTAKAYLEESLAIRREIGSRHGVADCLNNLGFVAQTQGDYDAARDYYLQSLAISREIGNRFNVAIIYNNLGFLALLSGDINSAYTYEQESLAIQREIGDRHGLAYTLNDLAHIAIEKGDYAIAHDFNEQSLALRREIGDRRGIAACLSTLGRLAYHQGRFEEARRAIEGSLAIRREISDPSGIGESQSELGVTAALNDDHNAALLAYTQGLSIARQLDDRYLIAQTLSRMAFSQISIGALDTADAGLHEALLIARHMSAFPLIYQILGAFSMLHLAHGDTDGAALLVGYLETHPTSARPWFRLIRERVRAAMSTESFLDVRAMGTKLSLDAALKIATDAHSDEWR